MDGFAPFVLSAGSGESVTAADTRADTAATAIAATLAGAATAANAGDTPRK